MIVIIMLLSVARWYFTILVILPRIFIFEREIIRIDLPIVIIMYLETSQLLLLSDSIDSSLEYM